MSKFDNLIQELLKYNKFAIIVHIKPDGDCLGSGLALKLALAKIGKQADVFCDYEIPDNYSFLPQVGTINQKQIDSYDTYVSVDVPSLNRMGKYEELFVKNEHSIKIDHHYVSPSFGNTEYVEIIGSCGEIIYELINTMQIPLDKDIAMCLYAAIASDTGCFMHNSTRAITHSIVSILMKYDIDIDKANYYLFKRRTLEQIKLLQLLLTKMQFELDGKLCISGCNLDEMAKINVNQNDTMGIVNTLTNIDGIEIGCVIAEDKPNLYSVSFRATNDVNVAVIAEVFGGGGHIKASGCKVYGTYNTVVKKIIDACQKFL